MADKDNLDEVKSPIIMKVDAPPEDNIPEPENENSSNEKKVLNESNSSEKNSFIPKLQPSKLQPSKLPVLAKPKLFGVSSSSSNPFAAKPSFALSSPKLTFGNNTPKPLLRPSKLLQSNSSEAPSSNPVNKPFVLTPSQLNPFAKATAPTPETTEKPESSNSSEQEECSSTTDDKSKSSPSKVVEPPKFVPLTVESSGSSSSSNATSSNNFQATATPSFVFGQNLHERVIAEAVEGNGIDSTNAIPSSSNAVSSNGVSSNSGSLFGSASGDISLPTSTTDGKSLSEAAREYQESRAQKRKYDEVTLFTGEENEENVMQIGCKLFAFDQTTRNWQERGRGNLRLNDIQVDEDSDCKEEEASNAAKITQSRLVVRSAGSLRVVLNTKIWAGMSVELASQKSIRLTAMDSQGVVKVFLVMANVKEIEKLHKLLSTRVEKEIRRVKKTESKSETVEEHSSKRIAIDSTSTSSDKV